MDRIQDFMRAIESDIAMESIIDGLKLVSLKVSSTFKSFVASIKQKFLSMGKKKSDEAATELFGFGQKKPDNNDRDRAATMWVYEHNAELAKKYPITGKDVYIDLMDSSPEMDLVYQMSNVMKQEGAWEQEIPLMSFVISENGKNKKALVAKMRANWSSMQVVSVGYLTMQFEQPVAKLLEKLKKDPKAGIGQVGMIYHEVWNITSGDTISDNKVVPICTGSFS